MCVQQFILRFFIVLLTFSLIAPLAIGTVKAQHAAQPKRYIAITFDDLPFVCRCPGFAAQEEITNKLLTVFEKFNMPILGVVNEQKLETNGQVDPAKVSLLHKWLEKGHELGNHGYAHRDINEITLQEYENEILLGERITRPLAQQTEMPYRFFRHPFLSAGDNLQVRKDLDAFLKTHNYQIAPNTITYRDYTFSGAYETALDKGDKQLVRRIYDAYLDYTLQQWEAAEKQSRELFGREIKQILMVHANRLNADAFSDVARMMQDRGYKFISMDEALTDPVYSREDTFDGKVGVTWLSRWAKEMGKSAPKQLIAVPDFVLELTGRK